jgi:hypothetical protein
MFKILILQAWYALSDEALEKQIARDLSFLVELCKGLLKIVVLFLMRGWGYIFTIKG